jgi:hypothetical protein
MDHYGWALTTNHLVRLLCGIVVGFLSGAKLFHCAGVLLFDRLKDLWQHTHKVRTWTSRRRVVLVDADVFQWNLPRDQQPNK